MTQEIDSKAIEHPVTEIEQVQSIGAACAELRRRIADKKEEVRLQRKYIVENKSDIAERQLCYLDNENIECQSWATSLRVDDPLQEEAEQATLRMEQNLTRLHQEVSGLEQELAVKEAELRLLDLNRANAAVPWAYFANVANSGHDENEPTSSAFFTLNIRRNSRY